MQNGTTLAQPVNDFYPPVLILDTRYLILHPMFGKRPFVFALAFFLLSLPAGAFAKDSLIFEFSEGKVNATWTGHGLIKMQKDPAGVILSTTGTGIFLTDLPEDFYPQAAEVTVSAKRREQIYFVWIYKDDPERENFDVPMTVPPGKPNVILFSLSDRKDWKSRPKEIGLALPPNTEVIAHRIELISWSPLEMFFDRIKSFWTMDSYAPYSINFLWGPELASNPVQRKVLFDSQPPAGFSATLILNSALLLLAISALFFDKAGRQRKRFYKIAAGLFFLFWLVLDLRMSSEFLSWTAHDYRTFISEPVNARTFRDRGRFYDFAEYVRPYLFDRSSYVFFATSMWPYLGNMRYLTYPAIPGIDYDNDDTWVIYGRPDVTVGTSNNLVMDNEIISEPGRILVRFDDSSFVFRTFQKPSPGPLSE